MHVDVLEVGAFGANCYLVWEDPGKALVFDPGEDAADIVAMLRERGLRPAAVLLTHGHTDHICGLAGVLATFPCPVFLSPADAEWCFSEMNDFPPYRAPRVAPSGLRPAAEAAALDVGGLSIEVLATPGHSPGSVCYRVTSPDDAEGVLFTGDTLFAGTIGRTDLTGGDMRLMGESLRALAALPESLSIRPGHGPASTIGHEKAVNPFLERF